MHAIFFLLGLSASADVGGFDSVVWATDPWGWIHDADFPTVNREDEKFLQMLIAEKPERREQVVKAQALTEARSNLVDQPLTAGHAHAGRQGPPTNRQAQSNGMGQDPTSTQGHIGLGEALPEGTGLSEIRFIAYGDWGRSGEYIEQVASGARKYAGSRDFTILLGDNFYAGDRSLVNDPPFNLFRNIVASDNPHYLVLGNMDYEGHMDAAQVGYSGHPRWHMPSRYYQETFTKGDALICAYFLDTEYLESPQLEWLKTSMSSDRCAGGNGWRIVSGHYPIWSASGSGDNERMTKNLLPILKKHKVSLYLCGHHHLHQVFSDGDLVEVVSGVTSDPWEPQTFAPHKLMIWGVSGKGVIGYADISVTRDAIAVNIVSAKNGRSFQTFTITSGGTKESMFGHIHWNRENSNADASIASSR